MQASRESKTAPLPGAGGPERYVLGMALLVPLGLVIVALFQLTGTSFASPPNLIPNEPSIAIMGKRPVPSNPAPPPTLVPPAPTPRPTATPLPQPTSTPHKSGIYTVQPGDELKHIAADHNMSIWKLIAANDIANPDSLHIGQEIRIPSD